MPHWTQPSKKSILPVHHWQIERGEVAESVQQKHKPPSSERHLRRCKAKAPPAQTELFYRVAKHASSDWVYPQKRIGVRSGLV